MTWLYVCLGIGVAVIAVLVAVQWLKAKREAASARAPVPGFDASGVSAAEFERPAEPLTIEEVMARLNAAKAPAEFAVTREHLLEPLSIAQVEARELVDDPLMAVPALPFGHLNPVWRRFLAGRADGDELWSFSARWPAWPGPAERIEGYAAVRGGEPAAYLATMRGCCFDA